MSKYILVYEVDEYRDEGGGTFLEEFGDNSSKMHERVNQLANEFGKSFSVICAGWLQKEVKYEPVTVVTHYKPNL